MKQKRNGYLIQNKTVFCIRLYILPRYILYICQRPILDSDQSEIRPGQCWIINSFIIKSSYFYDSWKINGSLIKMFVPCVPNHHIAYYNYIEKARVSFS